MQSTNTNDSITKLKHAALSYYKHHARTELPWRRSELNGMFDPYKILVSEVMLQQTQVVRVIDKFNEFIMKFPTVNALAHASLADVITAWSGLGYYRRAKYLHESAKCISTKYSGRFPQSQIELTTLPGIGKNTAGAIVAYSFNTPVVFIETNIRTVFLHHLFSTRDAVADSELLPFIEQALDTSNPREWYWALMDYGSHLKATNVNPSRKSKHHSKQTAFKGSRREVRGQVLKKLVAGPATVEQLTSTISSEGLGSVLEDLTVEAMITFDGTTYKLGK